MLDKCTALQYNSVKVIAFTDELEVAVLKADKLYIARYNDYYGGLLTERRREVITLYYDCDVSLFEIAEQQDISRQAVRDSIQRAEALLNRYEDILGLYSKGRKLSASIATIKDVLDNVALAKVERELDELSMLLEGSDGSI